MYLFSSVAICISTLQTCILFCPSRLHIKCVLHYVITLQSLRRLLKSVVRVAPFSVLCVVVLTLTEYYIFSFYFLFQTDAPTIILWLPDNEPRFLCYVLVPVVHFKQSSIRWQYIPANAQLQHSGLIV